MKSVYIPKNINKCDYCFKTGRKIGEGGQSYVYTYPDDKKVFVRTIPISNKGWKGIKNEILVSYFVSDLTDKICPHFPFTYEFVKCENKNVVHQIIEKFDGDVEMIFEKEIIDSITCFIQLLISVYCLMRKGLRHNDIKCKNILYKRLDKAKILTYKLDNKVYSFKTNIVLALSDFGKTITYPELKGKFELNPCMNMRDTINLLQLFNKNYEQYLCQGMTYEKGLFNTLEYLKDVLKPFEDKTSSEMIYDLDAGLPEFSSKGFAICFNEKLINLLF